MRIEVEIFSICDVVLQCKYCSKP